MKILITKLYDIKTFKLSKAEFDVVDYTSPSKNFAIGNLSGDRDLLFELKLYLPEGDLKLKIPRILQTIEVYLLELGLSFEKEDVYISYETLSLL